MGAFFSYSLQSALCLAIFYLFYTVVLSRETFHRLNRCMLLFIMALSWIIPLFAGALSFRTGVEVVPEMLVEQPLATLTAGGAAASLVSVCLAVCLCAGFYVISRRHRLLRTLSGFVLLTVMAIAL